MGLGFGKSERFWVLEFGMRFGFGFGIRNGVGGLVFGFGNGNGFVKSESFSFLLILSGESRNPLLDSNRGMGSGFRRKGLMLICNYSAFPLSSVNRLLSSD